MSSGEPGSPDLRSRHASLSGAPAFQAVLATRPRARSAHFVLHHQAPAPVVSPSDLSTAPGAQRPRAVDDTHRIGLILPKKQARRAVTRNLIRRQAKVCFAAATAQLPPGDWVLRLRTGYERATFPSAASQSLRDVVRAEIQALFGDAAAGRKR